MTTLSVATPSLPSYLPPRYEIRRLTEAEIPWINALVIHSNFFQSTVWPVLYPSNRSQRAHESFQSTDYLIRHQVSSGHSFGIFDLEYQYRTPEAQTAGGKLLWDFNDTATDNDDDDVSGQKLLEQMDFPLCSVALAYDGINPLDMMQITPLIAALPAFGTVYQHLEALDPRAPPTWKPTGPLQVLMRNATSTRHEYQGQGLMRKLADWLMRYAAGKGFRAVQIECLADQVIKVWSNPPRPFRGQVVCEFNTWDYSEDTGTGKRVNPFEGPEGKVARQRVAKCFVTLRETGDDAVSGEGEGEGPKNVPL